MTEELTLEDKLKAEVDQLPWSALVRHFAFGRVYRVRAPWTVIDPAMVLNRDNAEELKSAMSAAQFGIPTDDEIKTWHEAKQQFHVLVISPFVLIEELATPINS
ncbi:MAG: DUF2288 family protein [Oligoflexus sp.]|nr:DUF2288 family protein [Oligoflexus sp.]